LLAFIAAERREFDGLLGKADRVAELGWPLPFARKAWVKGEAIVLVANGPGPALAGWAAEVVRKQQELTGLVSTGFCGALNPALEACDIFVATEVLGLTHAPKVPRSHSCECKTGILLSVDRVVSTAIEKAELRWTGADAVEMEAGAVAAKAGEWNIPFYCIRVVTDTAGENFPLDFNRMRAGDGRFSRMKIVAAALGRPGAVFPELMKLNKRCRDASQALGNFIVDASF